MKWLIIKNESEIPIYKQIVNAVETGVANGFLKKGDKLPSINAIRTKYPMSRDTVLLAFHELKKRGLVQSITGKGYYLKHENVSIQQKVFLLFDELNAFKENLYSSFLETLNDENIQVDIFFHHFNFDVFNKLIYDHNGGYTHYIIMPTNFNNQETLSTISILPTESTYILDRTHNDYRDYPAVFQDFKKGIQHSLSTVLPKLKKYHRLFFIDTSGKQPEEMISGFKLFCANHQIVYKILSSINEKDIRKGDCYIVPEEKSLITLIKATKQLGFELSKDIGIISYNDSPLKEVVSDGITTISTDFAEMGKTLANMVKANSDSKIEIKTALILRESL